jgi:UDP-glucose 4-epimerase
MAILTKDVRPKILVTGSSGFIGTNLTRKLQNNLQLVPLEHSDGRKIDILDKNQLDIAENIDLIVHLASKTSIINSSIMPYETYLNNVMGTLNVLDFARQKNIPKIINFSTYVYGKAQYLPIDEKHPIKPHSPYTKSKIIAEKLCECYAEDYGLDIVTLRPFYIYGPFSNKASLIPTVIRQIKKENKVILSNENTRRDFLFVDDFINLLYMIILNFPRGYNVFNVGSGISHSLEEVVKIIQEIMEVEINVEYNDSIRPNDIVDMVADISLVETLYSWKPAVDIRTGLLITINDIDDHVK